LLKDYNLKKINDLYAWMDEKLIGIHEFYGKFLSDLGEIVLSFKKVLEKTNIHPKKEEKSIK
jgi:hypothetical protein